MNSTDEFVSFIEDDEAIPFTNESCIAGEIMEAPWRILIVDDDQDVHSATLFGLYRSLILNRPLSFLHAYSAAEAEQILRSETEIAVILLDVVMENDHAGLSLVHAIRVDLGNTSSRIILRTGQPGYAPEISAIREYDINDYKTKSELSHTRLYTSLTAAIRAFDQICRLESSRRGLDLIVRASSQLMGEQGLKNFASGVIIQLAGLIGVVCDGLVCVREKAPSTLAGEECLVIGAAGRFTPFIQRQLSEIPDTRVSKGLLECLQKRETIFGEGFIALYLPTRDETPFAAFIDATQMPQQPDRDLLGVFCNNVSLCAENIKLIEHLHDFAFMDQLVGLPNRTSFIEAIDDCLDEGGRETHCIALVDIDQFAEMNNAFGHAHGDAMLLATAHRMVEYFGENILVARLSGDSFGLLGKNEDILPERVRPAFDHPLEIEGVEHGINVSIGYVQLRDSSPNGNAALKDASIARKMAKQQGINMDSCFSPHVGTEARERTRLLHQLKGAFDDEHLFPMFQPQVDLQTGRPIGFEALMRWRGDDGLMISPDRFIPLAENSGMIVALGNWILRSSLITLRKLNDAGYRHLRMAVNVSVVQFRDPNFIKSVELALSATGVEPHCLELEITESVAMTEAKSVREILVRLRDLGVAIAIDDFGTGYSSLSYLEKLPADRLKIDRSFVASIEENKDGGRIAALIIQLARQLGMQTIAEGIEENWQRDALIELGCEEGQGFYFGRPMPGNELIPWLNIALQSNSITGDSI
jgi:diguanylate cyclase (GGDEF)-like protein